MGPPLLWISSKLTYISTSFYSTPPPPSIPLQLFLGSPSTAIFPSLNMYLCCRPSSSLVSRSYAVSLLPHGVPLSLSLLFKSFISSSFSDLNGFLFVLLPTLSSWVAFTERLVEPSPIASCPSLLHFSSLRRLFPPCESP